MTSDLANAPSDDGASHDDEHHDDEHHDGAARSPQPTPDAPRPPVRLIAVAAVMVLVVGLLVAWVRDRPTEAPLEGTELAAPIEVPDLVLAATDGSPFALRAQFDGKVTLLYFGYLNCPDACPITMDVLGRALATMPGEVREQVQVVFVTTDPDRDTPELVRAYLDRFDASFIGLAAEPADLAQLQNELLVPEAILEPADDTGNYLVGHATSVFIFDDGVTDERYPFGTRQSDWERVIRAYVDA